MTIYANLLIFGLPTLFCASKPPVSIISGSTHFQQVSYSIFSKCLFSTFTDDDEKEEKSGTAGHLQKTPHVQV